MENLTTTKEKVLAAAAMCSQAKEVLKTIFPEAFKDDGAVRISPSTHGWVDADAGVDLLQVRGGHNYAGIAFWLRWYWFLERGKGFLSI